MALAAHRLRITGVVDDDNDAINNTGLTLQGNKKKTPIR
jgi:hypothetical protein